jgi:surface protein
MVILYDNYIYSDVIIDPSIIQNLYKTIPLIPINPLISNIFVTLTQIFSVTGTIYKYTITVGNLGSLESGNNNQGFTISSLYDTNFNLTIDFNNTPIPIANDAFKTDGNKGFVKIQNYANLNTSHLTSTEGMFERTNIYDNGDNFEVNIQTIINNWDLSNVTNINRMFYNNFTLNQSFGDFDMSNIISANNFLDNTGLSPENYNKTLEGWNNQESKKNNVIIGVEGLIYDLSGASDRSSLISNYDWTLLGDNYPLTINNIVIKTSVDISQNIVEDCFSFLPSISYTSINKTTVLDNSSPSDYFYTYTISLTCTAPTYDVISTNPNQLGFYINPLLVYFNSVITTPIVLKIVIDFNNQQVPLASNAFECLNSTSGNFLQNVVPENINNCYTSHLATMERMFYRCQYFNSPINNWDVSNVKNMNNMFNNATNFNQPLNLWDVSNVTSTTNMFYRAYAFNQPLNSWTFTTLNYANSMFYYATSFNQSLDSWNMSTMVNCRNMFSDASSFNQPLINWNIPFNAKKANMFFRASSMNQDMRFLKPVPFGNQNNGLEGILSETNVSTQNYYDLLVYWKEYMDSIYNPSGGSYAQEFVGVWGLTYDLPGAYVRQSLIDEYGWSFNGDSGPAIPDPEQPQCVCKRPSMPLLINSHYNHKQLSTTKRVANRLKYNRNLR